MPSIDGQTDQVVQIKLKSYIVSTRWLDTMVSAGYETTLEVMTAYVGDTAPIEISVKDPSGKEHATVKGAMMSQLFRAKVLIPKEAEGLLTFTSKLSKHGLESKSNELRVIAPVRLDNLKWLDTDGKAITEWVDGMALSCEAQCLGAPEKADAQIVVYVKRSPGIAEWLSFATQVVGGKVKVDLKPLYGDKAQKLKTHADLHPTGEDYVQPELVFKVFCLGAVGESKSIAVIQTKVLLYEMTAGIAGEFAGKAIKVIDPSGEETSYTIPENGRIEILKTKPGHYEIDESEVEHLM